MKIEIIDHSNGHKEIEAKDSGIYVYDKNGNQYHIKLDKFGSLELSSTDGKLSIEPSYSNLVYIRTRE